MNILVSACLLGENCKYSGGNNLVPNLGDDLTGHGFTAVPFCPEQAGGLPTPRIPAERVGDKVLNKQGADVTDAFRKGAQLALERALAADCKAAILKKNSPSCGCGTIYDGSFSGTLTQGNGVTAELFLAHGISVFNEDNYRELFRSASFSPWSVSYTDGIWSEETDGRDVGREIPLGIAFSWAQREWLVPAVYVCREGLVVDVCRSAEPDALQSFIDRWNLLENDGKDVFTPEEEEQIQRENPLRFDYRGALTIGGVSLTCDGSTGTVWNPCVEGQCSWDASVSRVLEHYGLNPRLGWNIRRMRFPWPHEEAIPVEDLSLTLYAEKTSRSAGCWTPEGSDDAYTVTHPVTGEQFILTVLALEREQMEKKNLPEDEIEYPLCYTSMEYEVRPAIEKGRLQLKDARKGDRPRKNGKSWSGGGMVLLVRTHRDDPFRHSTVSELTFAAQEKVSWRLVFHETEYDPVTVRLI